MNRLFAVIWLLLGACWFPVLASLVKAGVGFWSFVIGTTVCVCCFIMAILHVAGSGYNEHD